MRLWTLHPVYLDARGLTACWREALLAQKVLSGQTQGYRHHPQLQRFRQSGDPVAAIGFYLRVLWQEANRRGYRFDSSRIVMPTGNPSHIPATSGQLAFEKRHLLDKLAKHAPRQAETLENTGQPLHHPLFFIHEGPVEKWEKTPSSPF